MRVNKKDRARAVEELGVLNSVYLTDEEYESYWFGLEGMRRKIAKNLGLKARMEILDVGTGWGLFALEMAKHLKKGKIVGIDIVGEDITRARKLVREANLEDIISIQKMDATQLAYPSNNFDLGTSFLGMRDIYMTRGKAGVEKTVEEMIRVIKPNGKIALCITPPEDMDTEDQRIAVKLEGEIFGAVSLPNRFYIDLFRENNVALCEKQAFLTNKKLTVHQTKIELGEGIEIAKRIYGKKVPQLKKVWEKHGNEIETFGYGMYSKIIMLLGQKLPA